ncbi:MAG: pterin-4-alpha-carbinolamine dehydratase [Candidatus Amesbacteria bacterium GW2011_GWC1_47_15]|uniref:4a-hydroxytetrahydrobiopterin dehydratase n=1 Tax=Candidatus Amesbacteria bacterium GW2011_GWC1_47_15 TaxID=1618364 RepID=A0A0G1S329_9BACT|nr:MAG: pterin-4-alpha-carbinolamine dehydratase [Candidatus Amesbacteria bacterium GW2011_GWC1_47_15]
MVDDWKPEKGKLVRELILEDFDAAVKLVNRIAVIAGELDHHPDIRIYDYKKLRIELYSHKDMYISG